MGYINKRGYSLLVSFFILLFSQNLQAVDYEDIIYSFIDLTPDEYFENTGLTVFPLLNISLGGEQQGLAGAYTAVARDLSFLEANPAGSPLQKYTELGVYYGNIIADINVENLAYSQHFGDLGIGAFFKLLHTDFGAYDEVGTSIASAEYIESVLGLNIAYSLFRDYYFTGLSLGANLKLAYRSIPGELYQHITGLANTDQSALGFMADLGLLTRFNFLKAYSSRDKNFSIGMSLQNFGPPVMDEALPTNYRFGLAYQPIRPLLISGDLKIPINLVDLEDSETPGFGFAAALQFVDFFSVRSGFYLQSGGPVLTVGTQLDLTEFSLDVNYELNISSTFGVLNHLSIQIKYKLGDEGRLDVQKKIDHYYSQVIGALRDNNYELVISLCDKILELDPSFNPAKDTKELAIKSLELEKDLEQLQQQNSTTAN